MECNYLITVYLGYGIEVQVGATDSFLLLLINSKDWQIQDNLYFILWSRWQGCWLCHPQISVLLFSPERHVCLTWAKVGSSTAVMSVSASDDLWTQSTTSHLSATWQEHLTIVWSSGDDPIRPHKSTSMFSMPHMFCCIKHVNHVSAMKSADIFWFPPSPLD